MELIVKPASTNLIYQIFFKEPALELAKEDQRILLINKFLKPFELRLDDLKFNNETPSGNYVHFSKFYGSSIFDVSFGLEEITASLQNPYNEDMVTDLYGKLFQDVEQISISHQKVKIQRQLYTEGNLVSFLESMNPYCPSKFKNFLDGRGVYFGLKIPEHELKIFITLVNSLVVPEGVYLSIENLFFPNKYDFQNAFKIAKKQYDFILKELNLSMKEGT